MQIGFVEVVNGCELERNWINEGGRGTIREVGGGEEEMNESLT